MRLRRRRPPRPSRVGLPAPPIRGTDLDGAPAEAVPGPGRTEIYFLTSSCEECMPVWSRLGQDGAAQVLAVTPDRATEDRRRLAGLVDRPSRLLMSTRGWLDYGVAKAPWLTVVVDGVIVEDHAA